MTAKAPLVQNSASQSIDAVPVMTVDASGNYVAGGGGGGGSLSAKANAATQTSTEGATTDPLSMDLSRKLRVIDADAVTQLQAIVTGLTDTSASLVKIDQTTPGTTNGIYALNGSIFWNGATGSGSALTGAATYTGPSRDSGAAAASAFRYAYFNAFFLADQAGTARIEASNDGTTWYTVATSALVANAPLTLSVPVMTRYHRTIVVNGAGAQTFLWVNSSYTGG